MSASTSIVPESHERGALRDALEHHRAGLVQRLQRGEDGMELGRANARFLHRCVRLLFEGARRHAGLPSGVALAATGSFGRGAVAVRSDADVVLIVGTRTVAGKQAGALVEGLLYPLWDAGLMVGHQILNVADGAVLAQQHVETATSLLDLSLLAGDAQLFDALIGEANEHVFGEDQLPAFLDRLDAETAARHERFGGSVYLLEPDVKSGAGGLRDLDGIRWAARARYRVEDTIGAAGADGALLPSGTWQQLVRVGVLVAREAQEIAQSEELLWRIRNRLHVRGGRRADRLSFDDQEALAVAMGYGDDCTVGSERLMQAFYLAARTVTRARSTVFERLRPARRRARVPEIVNLEGGVHLFDGQVTLSGTEVQKDPILALRAFETCVRHDAPLSSFTRDAIARAADDLEWCERLRDAPGAGELLVELLCTVAEARTPRGSVAGALHDTGLLLAMVPEFRPVVGAVHHDVYHVYTVDVHSVSAVDQLRRLARGELAHEFPLGSRLAAEIGRPKPLFLATLLHDVGKGYPDEAGSRHDHPREGADLCRRILPRLGLSSEDVDEVVELVRDHLLMYKIATARDIDDADTIAAFCQRLRGREGLRNLYLLTVADVTTTSPTAMTSWKAQMLEELYFAAESRMMRQRPDADAQRVARVVQTARSLWGESTAHLDALLASLPERYFIGNRPESIVRHARAVAERGTRPAHVVLVPSPYAEAAELCIVADDWPGLLASIAAALTANRLEVLSAEVYSHPVGAEREALDLFWVRDRHGGASAVSERLSRLARDLEDICSGRVTAAELLWTRTGSRSRWGERPSPDVPTEVLFDGRASPRHTIVEVYAKDRRGLLYRLAKALHELRLSIALSKINTEGARVADVFYVSERDGAKVAPGPRYREIHDALVRAAGES